MRAQQKRRKAGRVVVEALEMIEGLRREGGRIEIIQLCLWKGFGYGAEDGLRSQWNGQFLRGDQKVRGWENCPMGWSP